MVALIAVPLFISDIYSIIYQAESLVYGLHLEGISPFLPVVQDELLDLWRGIGHLDGIGLDVHHLTPAFLHRMLKIDHK